MAKNIDTMKTFLTAANDIVKALGEANPRDEEFDNLLYRHERLCQNALRYMDVQERISFFLSEMAEVENGGEIEVPPVSKITPIKPKRTRAKTEPAPEPEAEPAEEAPEAETAPAESEAEKPIDFATVKAAFTEAAQSGVKVAEIIADAGYSKLSEVPAELYGALLRILARKKNGED